MGKEFINIEVAQTVKILADLEYLVTSLDRIGSKTTSKALQRQELADFVSEGNVFKRLASIRKRISIALDNAVSSKRLLAIEKKLEKVTPWQPTRKRSTRKQA